MDIVDAVKSDHEKVVVGGHSVGSWIILQALRVRPEHIDSVFLLFPTICHIADTPNGHYLARLFRPPFPRVLSWLSVLTRLIPTLVLSTVIYPDWPAAQLQVLQAFLHSPSSVYSAVSMADEEMRAIKELDVPLLQQYRSRIHMYFGEVDNWVGKNKDAVLQASEVNEDNVKIAHGHQDIPHAFCINHGEQLAEQCFEWLHSGELPAIRVAK